VIPDAEIRRHLDSGERLIWTGAPKQGLVLRSSDTLMIPFSLLWGGFAMVWEFGALRSGGLLFGLWGIPFVLIGLYMIVGRFFADARIRANTAYGLTDRRVIIISGLFSPTSQSLPLRTLAEVSLRQTGDRSGTILLGRTSPFGFWPVGMAWPGASQYRPPTFEMIRDPKRVHDQILAAQRALG
jgi:hypothetical protein